MRAQDSDLWHRIAAHQIGPVDASLTFAGRLARENRWGLDHAERVIGEYRRFCYLAITTGHEVTPSDAVDQVWHLHLTYSRDYWGVFCPQVLGSDLHHGPTAGGPVERDRYYRQYAATLAAYEQAFGRAPPFDIWPAAARRFGSDTRAFRVKPDDAIIIPRPAAFGIALALALAGFVVGGLMGEWG